MAITNKLLKQVDLPVFEWMRFAPVATSSITALCTSDDTTSRYIYFLAAGPLFYRYDTVSDSFQQLATPNIAPVTTVGMKYSSYSGYRGQAIAGGASSITIEGLRGNALMNLRIRIISGTGAGQDRTITSISDSTIADNGVATAATALVITDSTKKWRINQWANYQVRITFGTGQSQVRKILYNDATTLTVQDINYQQIDSFNNTGFSAIAPYALPVAGSGYVIESSVATVDTPWTTVPDNTSRFSIQGGGIWLLSSAAAAPWTSFQWYDVISDCWYTKTALGGQFAAALGTDVSIDRTGEVAGTFASGTSSGAGTVRTLVNSSAGMVTDRWANHQIRITGGTGVGQRRRIVSNNSTTFFVERHWDVIPDATSTYAIYGDVDKLWMVGNGSAAVYQYSVEFDQWASGAISDGGLCRNASAQLLGATGSVLPQEALAIASVTKSAAANGILTVAVNAGGTGYVVGDLVTLSTTGTLGQAYVTSIGAGGVVTGLQLAVSGTGYAAGSSAVTGGTGSGLTITITVGFTALVTLAMNHNYLPGQSVALAGLSAENGNYVILGCGTATTFSVAASSATALTIPNTQSTTVLVDAGSTWIVNEHVGKLLVINTAGPSPTTQIRRITSNTANTITVPAITAAVNGTSRYLITAINAFGSAQQYKVNAQMRDGWATGGTATTLVDSTKNWLSGQWVGCRVRVIAGTGLGNEAAITASNNNTLTVASWPNATPDATSKYVILDSFGSVSAVTNVTNATITDSAKLWGTNCWAGKRFRITGGLGVGQELTVSSNTATVLTFTAQTFTTAPDTTSTYVIYEPPIRGAGCNTTWLFGLSDASKKGKFFISPRGAGSNVIDLFDITTSKWDLTFFVSPQTEVLNSGSMYTYDGKDRYFMQISTSGRIEVLDMTSGHVDACGTIPYAHGAATLGNKFEVVTTADGLVYLYLMRHTGQEFFRVLAFWLT